MHTNTYPKMFGYFLSNSSKNVWYSGSSAMHFFLNSWIRSFPSDWYNAMTTFSFCLMSECFIVFNSKKISPCCEIPGLLHPCILVCSSSGHPCRHLLVISTSRLVSTRLLFWKHCISAPLTQLQSQSKRHHQQQPAPRFHGWWCTGFPHLFSWYQPFTSASSISLISFMYFLCLFPGQYSHIGSNCWSGRALHEK